jgi:hypothetical protein
MKTEKIIGCTLMLLALIFAHVETVYFGSNFLPQSGMELLCDVISILIMISGIHYISKSK